MKKFMMFMLIAVFGVALLCAGSVKKAEALIIGTDLTFSAAELDAFEVQSSSHPYEINDVGFDFAVNAVVLAPAYSDDPLVLDPMSGVAGATGNWTAARGSSVNVFLGLDFAAAPMDLSGLGLENLRIIAYNDNDDIWGYDVWIETTAGIESSTVVEINGTTLGAPTTVLLSLDISGLDLSSVLGYGVSIHGELDGGNFPSGGDTHHSSFAPVPEPGTIALLGIGLAGLVGVGVRRRAKKNAA